MVIDMEISTYIIVILSCCLCIAMYFLILKSNYFNKGYGDGFDEGFSQGIECWSNRIEKDSYWFSEDIATMRLIQDLAVGKNPESVRETWRQNRVKTQ